MFLSTNNGYEMFMKTPLYFAILRKGLVESWAARADSCATSDTVYYYLVAMPAPQCAGAKVDSGEAQTDAVQMHSS